MLGSNVEKERNLPEAVRLLRERVEIVAKSAVYETAPVGTTDQPPFWNAAILIEWSADAVALKQQLGDIEQQLHRVRTDDPNAPRTIDIDITLFGRDVFEYGGRPIPDPELLEFAHIAVPVADVVGEWAHPVTGERIAETAGRLNRPNAIRKLPEVNL